MKRAELTRLQRMIDRSAKAHAASHLADAALMKWCHEHYGVEPGDMDADEIIDAVLGGCGVSPGMPAERFDEIMRGDEAAS